MGGYEMKKRIVLVLLALALIMSIFGALSMVASAETVEPQMSIAYCNLSFRDTVCIKYAVASNVSDVKILIWTSPESEYTVGTHDSEITEYYTEDIGGVSHMIFDYTKLTAKQMADVVYARAYAEVDGVDYYSEVNKYSILQYAYNKLGKTATATDDEELKEMLAHMLAYGTAAQKYFDYKEDRLATADWYQIKVTGGVLDDGSTHGLYLTGETVTLTAPETDAKGHVFSHWADSNGNEIATTVAYELTVGAINEIYTPIYEHTIVVDAAVAPTCNATGLTEGSHCSACGEVLVAQEVVAATGEHTFGEWVTVKEATTTEEGLMERVCGCGEKETQTIEKITPELAYTLNSDGKSYSVTGIGTWTDSDVVIPDTYNGLPVTVIGYDAFDSKPITSVVIPNSVTRIDTDAFRKCENLTSVTLGTGIKSIEYSAFEYCTSLTSISIPDSVTRIGAYAFNGCTSLSSLKLSNSISDMSYNAFSNCVSLVEVIIPYGVSVIGDSAFRQCTNLKFISIPESVTDVGYNAFYGCPRSLAIHIKGSSSITSGWDSSWNNSIDNQSYTSYSYTPLYGLNETGKTANGLYWYQIHLTTQDWSGESIEIIAYSGNDVNLVIPETINGKPVKMIRENAFRANTDIVSVTLPTTLYYIDQYAFYGCKNLMEVINKSALSISAGTSDNGYVAYYASVVHNGESSMLFEIDGYIFLENSEQTYLVKYLGSESNLVLPSHCNGNIYDIYKDAFIENDKIKSIIIANGVTSIGREAFWACSNLESIVIPESMTTINYRAFAICNKLANVYYCGTPTEWDNIVIDSLNEKLTKVERYYYSAAQPTDTNYNYWHYVNGVPTIW